MSLMPSLVEVSAADRLAELESVIERGVPTFMEVGRALAEIRDTRLYRETHPTFEAYCRDRWGFTDRRARQLIAASRQVESGTTVPVENERQARRLRDGEPDAPSAGWRELDSNVKTLRLLRRVPPKTVALVVPQRRRAGVARELRKLGTYLGHIAMELEDMG